MTDYTTSTGVVRLRWKVTLIEKDGNLRVRHIKELRPKKVQAAQSAEKTNRKADGSCVHGHTQWSCWICWTPAGRGEKL